MCRRLGVEIDPAMVPDLLRATANRANEGRLVGSIKVSTVGSDTTATDEGDQHAPGTESGPGTASVCLQEHLDHCLRCNVAAPQASNAAVDLVSGSEKANETAGTNSSAEALPANTVAPQVLPPPLNWSKTADEKLRIDYGAFREMLILVPKGSTGVTAMHMRSAFLQLRSPTR